MARLVNPGTGEVLDRLSILSLKILHAGTLGGKDVDHFRNERNALLTQVRGRNGFASWFEEYQQLGAVNAALWYAEDELRGYRQAHNELEGHTASLGVKYWSVIAECSFKIQSLNDERSRLIAAINQKTGEHYGQEKLNP